MDIFSFFSKVEGGVYTFNFDEIQIPFYRSSSAVGLFMEHKNISLEVSPNYLLFDFELETWKQILFSLLPLSNSIRLDRISKNQILFWGLPPKGCGSPLKYFSFHPPIRIKNNSCFHQLTIPMTKPKVHLNDDTRNKGCFGFKFR